MSAPIPIGSMVPLSGPSAADGIEFRRGLSLAAEEINAAGGVLGRPLDPLFVDSGRQTPREVVSAARRLIAQGVHAIVNGYNIGSQNAEYEPIADAGILYIHHNTLLQHHDTVASDPERYFGCFMGDPAEYWYGQGLVKLASWLRDSGQWRPRNNRIAILSGPKPYSIVIAKAIAASARSFGWTVCHGPEILPGATDWTPVLDRVRAAEPALLANTHFYVDDLARFQQAFAADPIDCLVYLQYGAMHERFLDLAGAAADGVLTATVIGLLEDEIGAAFARRYREKFGEDATARVGCQPYSSLHHYAAAVALAGGSGGPGDAAQNRRVAARLKSTLWRSVVGTIRYHPRWQSAIPYPNATADPSLGMPHLFFQVQTEPLRPVLIAPEPYNSGQFRLPNWR